MSGSVPAVVLSKVAWPAIAVALALAMAFGARPARADGLAERVEAALQGDGATRARLFAEPQGAAVAALEGALRLRLQAPEGEPGEAAAVARGVSLAIDLGALALVEEALEAPRQEVREAAVEGIREHALGLAAAAAARAFPGAAAAGDGGDGGDGGEEPERSDDPAAEIAERLERIRDAVGPALGRRLVADPVPSVRLAAVEALVALADGVRSVVAIGDRDHDVRWRAVAALRDMREATPPLPTEPLASALAASDEDIVAAALAVLERHPSPAFDDAVRAALASTAPAVRLRAVRAAASRRLDPALLYPLLGDADVGVRGSAAEALGRVGDARAIGPLLGAAEGQPVEVARPVFQALERITGARDVPPSLVHWRRWAREHGH